MANKKIIQKMRERSASFIADPEGTQALQIALAEKAMAAVMGGIDSEAWRTYMLENAVNNEQLQRLRGQDDMVNEDWGQQCLVYIASAPSCSLATTSRAEGNLSAEMIAGLDDGVSDEVDPKFPGNADPL